MSKRATPGAMIGKKKKSDENRIRTCAVRDQTLAAKSA